MLFPFGMENINLVKNSSAINGMKASVRFLIFATLLLLIVSAKAQIISGPLLGYTDMREICIRLEVDKNVKGVTIKYRELKEKGSVDTNIHSGSINYTGSLVLF